MLLLDAVCVCVGGVSSIILGTITGILSPPNMKFSSEDNIAMRLDGFR